MMAKVLDFVPRAEYDTVRWERIFNEMVASVTPANHDAPTLTSGEVYSILYGETAESCKRLVRFYKHSGKWNTESESQMTKIVKSLQTLCETLAHATTRPAQTK